MTEDENQFHRAYGHEDWAEGIAAYDQLKAEAIDALRNADGFVMVVTRRMDDVHVEEGQEVLEFSCISGVDRIEPLQFIAHAVEEVSDLMLRAVKGFPEDDES